MEFLDKIEFVLREGVNNFTDFLCCYLYTFVALFFLLIFVFYVVLLVLWIRGDI